MRRALVLTALVLLVLIALAIAAVAAPAVEASGKVLLKAGGSPAPQALVEFTAGAQKARAVTLDDGTFYIPSLPAGTYAVTVHFRGQVYTFPNTPAQKGLVFKI